MFLILTIVVIVRIFCVYVLTTQIFQSLFLITTNHTNMTIFVAKIHNGSLGNCLSVTSYDAGKELIRSMFEEQFNRSLDENELDDLENKMEVYNDNDADNVYTFSIGTVE